MTYQPVRQEQHTAFDELFVAEATPIIQIQFPYNINADLVEARENNLGTVTQADGMAVLQSGASANSAAHMLSRVPLRYSPGQGALVRLTALFTPGVADSVQLAGIGEVGDGLFFGFNGTAFSILRREQGKPEIQTLTVSVGAPDLTGNITINVDGVAKVVAVTIGDSAREVAAKIAAADFSDTGLGWTADLHNDTVIFKSWSDGNKVGAFTLVDTDSTGAVGVFAETVAGVSTTNEWIAQTAWSVDLADGTGRLPALDPTKGNVYQIRYQWLGFGVLTFSIEDPSDGQYRVVHRIEYSNDNVIPSLQNPTLPLHMMSQNTANTSNLTMKAGSMAGFVEGRSVDSSLEKSANASNAAVATTEIPILSVKNNMVYQAAINRVRIQPDFLSLSTEGSRPIIFRVRLNTVLTGTPAYQDVDAATSVASVDSAATAVDGGEEILTVVLGKTDSLLVPLADLKRKLNPGESLTVTAEATGGSGHEASVGANWSELF